MVGGPIWLSEGGCCSTGCSVTGLNVRYSTVWSLEWGVGILKNSVNATVLHVTNIEHKNLCKDFVFKTICGSGGA